MISKPVKTKQKPLFHKKGKQKPTKTLKLQTKFTHTHTEQQTEKKGIWALEEMGRWRSKGTCFQSVESM